MKIVFLDAATVGSVSLDPIASLGELVTYPLSTPRQAIERVADADIVIVNKVSVDKALLDAGPSIKLICEAATGVNNIDLKEAERRGIPVRNVAGYSTDSVVQMTFALLLEAVCGTSQRSRFVKDGSYSASPVFTDPSMPFMELSGKTMGIVGMGTIGQKVASVATAFGMKVIYFSTSGTSHCKEYPSVSIEELMRQSDIISIHAPLNPLTDNLIDAPQLALAKPTAYIVNIGRGGIVNETALADAIDREAIAGAALDVFVCEPLPADNPLLHTRHPERLTFTPHIGWASDLAISRLIQGVADNIKSFISK